MASREGDIEALRQATIRDQIHAGPRLKIAGGVSRDSRRVDRDILGRGERQRSETDTDQRRENTADK